MIAFKTYANCPTELKPVGIPDEWPWTEVSIQPSEASQYQQDGYMTMVDEEYWDYVEERRPAFYIWAVAANFGDNPIKDLTDYKAEQGFEVYRELVSLLDQGGGISSVDSGLEVYAIITPLRNMLKDGFFTYALRHYCKNIKPLELFPVELDAYFVTTLRDICESYGSTVEELDNIETGVSA